MKQNLLIAASLLCVTAGALAQGTIFFNDRVQSSSFGTVVAPIFGPEPSDPSISKKGNPVSTWNGTSGPAPIPAGNQTYGGAPLLGTGYTAELWGGVSGTDTESTLRLVASAPFRVTTSQSLYGFWAAPAASQVVPGVPSDPNVRGVFQVRAWDNRGGTITSWAAALAAKTTVPSGSSDLFVVPFQLGGLPSPTAPNLAGLQSFNLFTTVPEPSVIALGVLGAGCLFLLRRRK